MEMFIIIKCHTYGKDARKNIASSHHRTAKHLRIRFFGAKDPKYIVLLTFETIRVLLHMNKT